MKILSTDNSTNGFASNGEKLGDSLRGERATMGKSLLDVQRDLHIKAEYIAAIENCDVSGVANPSFIAGYVRSYARYLGLEPENVFVRFCDEAGFISSSAGLGPKPKQRRLDARQDGRPITNPQGWVPKMPGNALEVDTGIVAGRNLMAAAPALVLALVVIALGYGVWFVIQDIQRVEFAPIDSSPQVASEPEGLGASNTLGADGFTPSDVALAADPSSLYEKIELDVPIVQPRDGPILAINPDADNSVVTVASATETAPIVSETPHIPSISIIAQQEAWVRVYNSDGTVVFEKLLAAGEQYALAADTNASMLRAGNATAVYLMIDDEAYGPISASDSVVSGVSLAPSQIASAFSEVENPSVAIQVAAQAWREMNVASVDN